MKSGHIFTYISDKIESSTVNRLLKNINPKNNNSNMRNKATSSFGHFCSKQNQQQIFQGPQTSMYVSFSSLSLCLFIRFFQFKAPIGNLISWIWLKSKWTMTVRLAHHWIFGIYFLGKWFHILRYDEEPILVGVSFTNSQDHWCHDINFTLLIQMGTLNIEHVMFVRISISFHIEW